MRLLATLSLLFVLLLVCRHFVHAALTGLIVAVRGARLVNRRRGIADFRRHLVEVLATES